MKHQLEIICGDTWVSEYSFPFLEVLNVLSYKRREPMHSQVHYQHKHTNKKNIEKHPASQPNQFNNYIITGLNEQTH